MGKKMKIAIAGLGSRGKEVYAKAALLYPEKMEITAVADIDSKKVELAKREFNLPEEACFGSANELLSQEKLADGVFITTLDKQHVSQAILALKKGYHILLEKPISPDLKECKELLHMAEKYDRKIIVCHVLRYTPIYQKVKELLDAGEIGEVVSIMAVENVGWFHQAHSFVRGNWAVSEETSPMILQKCCHDMDLYLWLANKTCQSITSYGDTYLFKKEQAPEGCSKRCLDGCKIKEECPFDAEKIYLDNRLIGYRNGNRLWPLDVILSSDITEDKILEALRTGRYGRCVYHCENNVVDHQIVNMKMTDGTTMSFTMNGFSSDISRYAKFMGTKGELIVNLNVHESQKDKISIHRFQPDMKEENIEIKTPTGEYAFHGGGDMKLVEEFLDIISGERVESTYVTSLEKSVESHYCALAAEYSRIHNGIAVELEKFKHEE